MTESGFWLTQNLLDLARILNLQTWAPTPHRMGRTKSVFLRSFGTKRPLEFKPVTSWPKRRDNNHSAVEIKRQFIYTGRTAKYNVHFCDREICETLVLSLRSSNKPTGESEGHKNTDTVQFWYQPEAKVATPPPAGTKTFKFSRARSAL